MDILIACVVAIAIFGFVVVLAATVAGDIADQAEEREDE